MSIYLIDFENVHYDGLGGILNLSPEDEIYIFYSDNGKRLTFELHEQINHSKAKFYYYKAAVGGKNALDHQLSTYLGFLIGKKDEKKYYIISKDQGFRYLVTFWKSANLDLEIVLADSIRISRHASISDETPEPEEESVAQEPGNTRNKSLARQLTAVRRGRQTRAKSQPAKPVENNASKMVKEENEPIPPNMVEMDVTVIEEKKDKAPKKASMTKGFKEITKEKAGEAKVTETKEKILPKVIEFVLPQEVFSSVKQGGKSFAKPDDLPAQEKSESPAAPQESVSTQTLTAPSRRRAKSPISKPLEKEEEIKAGEKRIINEAEIIQLIPEAQEQGWATDLARYINSAKGKAELYNMIRRRLGQEKGRDIYNRLKKLF